MVQTFVDPAQAIHIVVDELFAIALAGNPTTGYTWQIGVDERYLILIDQEFEPAGEGVGAGGQEVCRFRALKAGETEVTCIYQRPWGGEARDEKHFRVVIA